MNKTLITIIGFIAVLVTLQVFLKPRLREKNITNFVESVLEAWQEDNLATVMSYWNNQTVNNIPPIEGIVSYSIKKVTSYKEEKTRYADVFVLVELAPNALFPSAGTWQFHLKKLPFGWQILTFELVD